MQEKETCKKVTSLLGLYIDNKLDEDTKRFVFTHLEYCQECHEKYLMLKQLIFELRKAYNELILDIQNQEKKHLFYIKEYEKFHSNLSAYFDNELPLNESLNIKKYMIKFPNARQDLEEMYELHNLISDCSSSVKKTMNQDFSKKLSYKIQGKPINYRQQLSLKIASYALIILTISLLIFSTLPQGKTVIEKGLKYFKKTIYVEAPSTKKLANELKTAQHP